jgi:hypothetical protein
MKPFALIQRETRSTIQEAIKENEQKRVFLEVAHTLVCINMIVENQTLRKVIEKITSNNTEFSDEQIWFFKDGYNQYNDLPQFIFSELKKCCILLTPPSKN